MKNDVISLLQSEGFLAKLNDASTPEEVCEIFSKEGYEISFEKWNGCVRFLCQKAGCTDGK